MTRRKQQPRPLGDVDVVTAQLLVVDPAWLPDDLVVELNAISRGLVIDVGSDGPYTVFRNPDGSHTID